MFFAEMRSIYDSMEGALEVRQRVFQEEQHIEPELERDGKDSLAMHCVVEEDQHAVGTGRIVLDLMEEMSDAVIGRICVDKDYRGKGYGDLIVRKLMEYGFRHGVKRIQVNAVKDAIPFYEKIGFQVKGEPVQDMGRWTQPMTITKSTIRKGCSS